MPSVGRIARFTRFWQCVTTRAVLFIGVLMWCHRGPLPFLSRDLSVSPHATTGSVHLRCHFSSPVTARPLYARHTRHLLVALADGNDGFDRCSPNPFRDKMYCI
ncbi:hypothetical protein BJY52DRAFT_1319663 [Lactarius psammicola]|nr:hypothetical protein BJY52DRAFT_1319663 [Lactarius psammicola]